MTDRGAKKQLLGLYRRFLKALSACGGDKFPFDRIDRRQLSEVVTENRRILSEIGNWLPEGLLEGSVFHYGINAGVDSLINLPLDNQVMHADLLTYFGRTLGRQCRYLELGVSVGKTIWQVIHTCAPCECYGFDIEEINPALKANLVQLSRDEFPTPAKSIKRTPSSITRFHHPASGSTVVYICADIFDGHAWSFLAQKKFNLLLSDALHTPEALDFEWKQMIELGILDLQDVVIMWDDLDGPMRSWFEGKREIIARDLGITTDDVDTVFANGWLGRREFLHRLGLAIKIRK